ncbi:solute carrier family 28 member 3 isoform X1 [Coregonus clupeaformis]|uniref:solute carrier family 28 member 3 isoform X1 n=1 Tax=Coregonus clupeaformis TaxID=59861 RepID=UPI001E1C2F40|nr:solute carrier family 28 member 3 isoform X1 [Coregonus clupeaformis]
MELNGLQEKSQRNGLDNQAFYSQDTICIDMEVSHRPSEDAEFTEELKKKFLENKMEGIHRYLEEHRSRIRLVLGLVLAAGYVAVVIAACVLNLQRALALLVLTLLAVFFLLWDWLMGRYGQRLWDTLQPARNTLNTLWVKWVVFVLLLVAVVCWLVFDTAKQGTRQLVSFSGLVCFVMLMLVFSRNPFRVSWRTLLWGVALQFLFGLIILRTKAGFTAVDWLGHQVEVFLSYTDTGSRFVFGNKYTDHFFAFKVLPIVVFFSTVISMLYYLGFMQWLILKVGFIMQITMGTSPTESMVAAGNIFVGQTESPLLIRPYISQLTLSEIHAVMAGGFATIAGSVLGAFISFGIEASHLLTASVMSAPASLAIAKTFWPETEIPKVTAKKGLKLETEEGSNLLEAASHGASSSIVLVANIAVNLIAFLALLAFLNAVLSWLGNMFDYPQLSFSIICSYVFMPFSFLMGVAWEDSFMVGELIGYKTFFNEFVAYQRLAELIKRREDRGPEYVDDVKQYLSVHSETIATYALCGFANISSLGVMIGGLSAMAPERRGDISRCAIRALISGTVACFMTACIAGMLYIPELLCEDFLKEEFNSTLVTNSTQLLTCCTELYHSVVVGSPSNMTLGGGFNMASLNGCCAILSSPHFKCSLVYP